MSRRFDRRTLLARGAAIAGAGLVAGAVGEGAGLLDTDPAWAFTNGPGRNGISQATPKVGGSLIFGADAEETGFDPTSARFDETGYMYARTVFDSLTCTTTSGGWAPYLAESVVPNAELTSWTITLRPNLMFHDGTPCNGAALLLNLDKQRESALTGPAFATSVSDVVQTGPLSVRVDVKEPWGPFPYYLATQVGFVAAPSMLNSPNGTEHPIGTGPFNFKIWDVNNHFTATRNTRYWRSGYPYLDQITFRPIVDSGARQEALETGTVDIIVTNSPQNIRAFRHNTQWSYVDDGGKVVGEPNMNLVMLNTSKPPFDNRTLRLAMAKSVDRAQFAKIIDYGVNAPSNGPYVPGTPWYTRQNPYPNYDQGASRRLIKQVEQQTGKPVTFTLSTIPDPDIQRAAAYLQSKWAAVGATATIITVQQSDLIDNALEGDYEAVTWRQFQAVDPDLNYVWWSTTTVDPGLSLNMARNSDPVLQKALLQGRSSTDQEEREDAYHTVLQRLNTDLPYLWGDRSTFAIVANPKVQNFNNPRSPGGEPVIGMDGGAIWPTQVWLST